MVLQTVIAQWNADLEALMPLENTQVIDWDGQVLRMTRKSSAAVDDGAVVVAWARRQTAGRDQWLRWQSPPLRTRAQRSEEHTSELQSPCNLVCRLLLEKKKSTQNRASAQHHVT